MCGWRKWRRSYQPPLIAPALLTAHTQPPALYSADVAHSFCWLRMSSSRSMSVYLVISCFFEAESGGACAAEGVDEDFVDPWSVNAAADTGIDYDKLISE